MRVEIGTYAETNAFAGWVDLGDWVVFVLRSGEPVLFKR